MKKSVRNTKQTFGYWGGLLVLVLSCNAVGKHSGANQGTHTMDGVWKLSAFYRLAGKDTLITDTTKIQHKIYLNGHVIWNVNPEADDLEWHGYGAFTYKNDTIIETLKAMSKTMQGAHTTYIIPIERGKGVYKQINTYKRNDTVYHNVEVYTKLD